MKTMPNYAGLRDYRKTRTTGTHVGLYDGEEAGMDTDGGRWQTVCEEHGHIISHTTLAVAQSFLSHPEEWCEACMYEWFTCSHCGADVRNDGGATFERNSDQPHTCKSERGL